MQGGPRTGPQEFTDGRKDVSAHANLAEPASAGATVVRDETAPHSPSDRFLRDLEVRCQVSRRSPRLTPGFDGGESSQKVVGLHAGKVEHVDMLANEAINVDHVKEPSALRAAPRPAATDQQTRFDAPADDCAVVESEDPLEVPQAEPSHPA